MNRFESWQAAYRAAVESLRALESAANEARQPATCVTASMCLAELSDAYEFDSAASESRT